jgi:hypothetical protein
MVEVLFIVAAYLVALYVGVRIASWGQFSILKLLEENVVVSNFRKSGQIGSDSSEIDQNRPK